MRPFGHLFCTNCDHFLNKRLNRCAHAYTAFQYRGFSRPQNQLKGDISKGMLVVGTAQTAQFWVMGIISGASGHPNDVPFVCEFWWGAYGLGAVSPRKTPVSAIIAIDIHCADCTQQFSIWHLLRAFSLWLSVTCKGTACPFQAYIPVSLQIHCNPSSWN